MLYAGCTADLDASALANQGSIVACQFPLVSQTFNYAHTNTTSPYGVGYAHIKSYALPQNFPGVNGISQMPGAYMGLAKDGCYMPLKIDPDSPWQTTTETVQLATANQATVPAFGAASLGVINIPPVTTVGDCFPAFGSLYYGRVNPCNSVVVGATGLEDGTPTIDFQQHNMGQIAFYNLAVGAALTVKVMWGCELRVGPLSVLAPAMQPSAMTDPQAMHAYSDIAGSLPWAYPSSYNSWEEIVKVLKSTWNALKPVALTSLSAVPHPFAQGAAQMIKAMPAFQQAKSKQQKKKQLQGKQNPKRPMPRLGKPRAWIGDWD